MNIVKQIDEMFPRHQGPGYQRRDLAIGRSTLLYGDVSEWSSNLLGVT